MVFGIVFAVIIMTIFLLPLLLGVAVCASVVSYLIGKVPDKRAQAILPVAIALIFIAGYTPIDNFFRNAVAGNELLWSIQSLSMLFQIPFIIIVAMGAITLFPLVREHLTLTRPWFAIVAASVVAADYINIRNFMISMMHGPYPTEISNFLGTSLLEIVFQSCIFLSAMILSAAVFGVILFLQHAGSLVAAHRDRRGILICIVISLLILLPAAGVGGLAVFFRLVLQKLPGRILQIVVATGAVLVLALAGIVLSGISGMGSVVDLTILTMVIMALAVLVPFLYFFPVSGNDRDAVILLAGAVAADIVLSLLAVTLDLGERLTADPVSILTFASGGMVFAGCIFCAGLYIVTHQKNFPVSPGSDEVP
jgi:hypothetical protein